LIGGNDLLRLPDVLLEQLDAVMLEARGAELTKNCAPVWALELKRVFGANIIAEVFGGERGGAGG